MASTIQASIVVQFGDLDAADSQLSIEVDGRPEGLNGGNTSFSAGATVYLLAHKSANVELLTQESSAGSFIKQSWAEGVDIEDEYIIFTEEDEATLAKPLSGNFTYEWLGNSLGSISSVLGSTKIKTSLKGVAVAKVSYTSNAIVYKLDTPALINGSNEYQILCVLFAEVN